MNDGTLLHVSGLSVKSNGGKVLVKNSSFDIAGEQCIGIIGESGSGKSMTCKAIRGC